MKLIKSISENSTPRWIVLVFDVYIVVSAFLLSYFIRYNLTFDFDVQKMGKQIPLVAVTSLLSFLIFGLYKGVIRHSGMRDMLNIFKATIFTLVLLIFCSFVMRHLELSTFVLPYSILLIHFLLCVIFLATARHIFKYLYGKLTDSDSKYINIMIYGAGNNGVLTASALRNDKNGRFKVCGFIDDDKRKVGNKIDGLPIYHESKIDAEFISAKNIDELVISIQKLSSEKLLEITEKFSDLSVKVKIVPVLQNWINGVLEAKQIKEINIEDLLGREPINFENSALDREFKSKTILITGAAGSIGSEIAKQISRYKCEKIIIFDIAESALFNLQQYFAGEELENLIAIVGDVRNKKKIEHLFKEYKPDIVFHASAYKHVPFMEDFPYESVRVNVYGTKIVADLSVKYNVDKMVMVSTDKAVNPTNVMGATKRIAEMYVSSLKNLGKTKFITTRFGNVLGSNGSVIPTFKGQIERGGPLTVTHKEITRYFMTIPEACRLVLEAAAMGGGGEIFVFDMGKSVKIFDLAVKMIKLSGLRYPEDINIKITGLRPGEKIYEEVLATSENTMPTYNDRIKIAKVRDINADEVNRQISNLCDVNNEEMNDFETVTIIKKIVPEFISNNSKYSVLDNPKN